MDKVNSRHSRLNAGLTALVVSILVACGGNSIPVATEPQASGPGPQREEVTILATAVPVAETKASANKTATSDDSSAESQTPSPALTVAANGGTTFTSHIVAGDALEYEEGEELTIAQALGGLD